MMRGLFLLLLSSTLLLTGCGGQAVFSANFEDGTAIPEGVNLVNAYAGVLDRENALRVFVDNDVRGQTAEMLFAANAAVNDYSIVSRLRIHTGQLRLFVRGDERGCSGYVLVIDPTLDTYRLSIAEDCALRTLCSSARIDVRNDEWMDVRLEVRGSRIQAFVNGALFFDVEDATHTAGIPLVQLFNDSTLAAQVEFDNLMIQP